MVVLAVPVTVTVTALKAPVMAEPLPLGPAASMKYSAAVTVVLPVVRSLMLADNATVPFELGVATMELVSGPIMWGAVEEDTLKAPETLGPQLPAASLARTYAM